MFNLYIEYLRQIKKNELKSVNGKPSIYIQFFRRLSHLLAFHLNDIGGSTFIN